MNFAGDYAAHAISDSVERVVSNSVSGQKTTAHEIATEVFGRPGSFDSTKDPIVRIEAGKLRRDLETYYLKGGKHDRVRISLLKGRYIARSAYVTAALPGGAPTAAHLWLLRTALLGLQGADDEARQAWTVVLQELADFRFDSHAHELIGSMSGQDGRVRELLLEGLRRAEQAPESATEYGAASPVSP
ncbi:MAG: hypothetical protein ACO3YO_06515 [Chthoniobacterales bacterium]